MAFPLEKVTLPNHITVSRYKNGWVCGSSSCPGCTNGGQHEHLIGAIFWAIKQHPTLRPADLESLFESCPELKFDDFANSEPQATISLLRKNALHKFGGYGITEFQMAEAGPHLHDEARQEIASLKALQSRLSGTEGKVYLFLQEMIDMNEVVMMENQG